jgi:hypothetical protein
MSGEGAAADRSMERWVDGYIQLQSYSVRRCVPMIELPEISAAEANNTTFAFVAAEKSCARELNGVRA